MNFLGTGKPEDTAEFHIRYMKFSSILYYSPIAASIWAHNHFQFLAFSIIRALSFGLMLVSSASSPDAWESFRQDVRAQMEVAVTERV